MRVRGRETFAGKIVLTRRLHVSYTMLRCCSVKRQRKRARPARDPRPTRDAKNTPIYPKKQIIMDKYPFCTLNICKCQKKSVFLHPQKCKATMKQNMTI